MIPVHQLVGALHAGDAVGHEALAIQTVLRGAGHASEIFAGQVDAGLFDRARPLRERPRSDAAFVYHFSPGSPATQAALEADGPLGLVYHNVTPAAFFARWAPEAARLSARAPAELSALAARAVAGVAHSEFSRADLLRAGVMRAQLVPYPVPRRPPGPECRVLGRLLNDGRPTFLAVGRIVPSKRLEDVIAAFAVYQRRHAPRGRLLLVGETASCPRYAEALPSLASALGAREVVFTGRVSGPELAAAYAAAAALVCLSAHEGYGVPLIEAMQAEVPVLARDAGAVRETLRGGGVLVTGAAPGLVADLMAAVSTGGPLRESVLASQRQAVAAIEAEDFGTRLLSALAPLLAEAA